jgi:hypothetical protein
MATTGTTATPGGNGAGSISDAFAAFAAQAVKLAAGPTPDADVATAFALGWSVGDALIWAQTAACAHLPKVADLNSDSDRWKLLINQITSRLQTLHGHLKDAGDGLDLSDELNASTGLHLASPPPADVDAAVGSKARGLASLNDDVLAALWSTEPALGKAYQLGRHLEQMCVTPTVDKDVNVTRALRDHADMVHSLLNTLASKLPPNSAHATYNSLRLWWATLHADDRGEPAEALLHQGWRWREVLAGEVAGKDGLRLGDYMLATDSVAGQLRQAAKQIAKRFYPWLIAALIITCAGIGLIVLDTTGTIAAGLATVFAALGLTWKGIGEFFGRVAATGEEHLWDAELDWAIAYRFTLCHRLDSAALKALPNVADVDKPTAAHVARFKEWKNAWPDVSFTAAK